MSLHLEFEPHSWYMGAAIMDTATAYRRLPNGAMESMRLDAYYLNGMTGYVEEFKSHTLADVKQQIKDYVKR